MKILKEREERNKLNRNTRLIFFGIISIILVLLAILVINNNLTEKTILNKNSISTKSSDELLSLQSDGRGGWYVGDENKVVATFVSSTGIVTISTNSSGQCVINNDLMKDFLDNKCGRANVKQIVFTNEVYAPSNSTELFSDLTNLTDITNSTNFKVTPLSSSNMLLDKIFLNCSSLKTIDVSSWNTSNVTSMIEMFSGCSSLTHINGTNNWNVDKVINMQKVFMGCSSLQEINVTSWTVKNADSMWAMFHGCSSLRTIDVSNWQTEKLTNADGLFTNCSSLVSIEGINKWKVNNVLRLTQMFLNCSSLESIDVSGWVVTKANNMNQMFRNCKKLTTIDISSWKTPIVEDMAGMFMECTNLTEIKGIDKLDVTSAKDMSNMFTDCISLREIDVSNWRPRNATNMYGVFLNCRLVEELDVSKWETGSAQNMSSMFNGCVKVKNLDVSNWDTKNVQNMDSMFRDCVRLESIDVSKWNTRSLENMNALFYNCNLIPEIDAKNWNTSNLRTATHVFYNCTGLTKIDLGSWDTTRLENTSSMFDNCSHVRVIDLNNWDVTTLTQHTGMFNNCNELYEIYTPKIIPSGKDIVLPASDYRDIDKPEERKTEYATLKNSAQQRHIFRGIFILFNVEEVKDYLKAEYNEYIKPEAVILPKEVDTEENIFPEGVSVVWDQERVLADKGCRFTGWEMNIENVEIKTVTDPYRSRNFPSDVIYTPQFRTVDRSYQVNYLEEGTNEVLKEAKIGYDVEFGSIVSSSDEVVDIVGYRFVRANPETLEITTGENIINLYYVKRNDLRYIVNYLEKDTREVIKDQKVVNNVTFKDVINASDEVVNIYGYRFDSASPEELTIGVNEGNNVINLYYIKKDASVLVHHYLEGTETKVAEDVLIEGKVNDDYESTAAEDLQSKYELVSEPENKSGKMTEEQIEIIYYYKVKPAKVIVHHYEEGTTNKISEDVLFEGKVDDDYTTTALEDLPSKYELVSEPENKSGKMTEEQIEVIYYYKLKRAKVIVHYYEEGTTNKLSEDVEIEGGLDTEYKTTSAKDIPSKYELVKTPDNATGKITEEPIEVIYYYKLKQTKVIVHYYEEGTTNKLSEDVEIKGVVDSKYTTTPASDIPSKYELVSEPANKAGVMTESTIEVIYYYKLKAVIPYTGSARSYASPLAVSIIALGMMAFINYKKLKM